MTAEYDAVVVGASCAGLAFARSLARSGARTLVIDSRRTWEVPRRTWIVTPTIRRVLDCSIDPSVIHRTGVMELFVGTRNARVRLDEPDLILERGILRRVLAEGAERAGVELLLGRRVQSVELDRRPFRLTVSSKDGTPMRITARHVVGADGVNSIVAETMRVRPLKRVPIVQAKVRLPTGYDPRVTRVWFDRDRTRFFYWLIPDSDRTGVVGLAADRASRARVLVDDFLREKKYRAEEYQAAMIPLHDAGRPLEWRNNGGRALLVGDAAGHVKVTTVGGVVTGIRGALAAARAITLGTPYQCELKPLRRELLLHDMTRAILDCFVEKHYERLLGLLNQELRSQLAIHDRDNLASSAWGLLKVEPRLVSLAAKALVRRQARYGNMNNDDRTQGSHPRLHPTRWVEAIRTLVVFAACAMLAACASGNMMRSEEASVNSKSDTDIGLRSGDVVQVKIWREPDLSGDFVVDQNGVVVLPLLGQRQVVGVSVDHLERRLVEDYGKYLENSAVDITVLRRISILGAVRNPGLYTVDPTFTLREAVALAGGISPLGNENDIRLIRDQREIRHSLDDSVRLGSLRLRSGDQVMVGERSWISRNVPLMTAVIGAAASLVAILGVN